MVFMTARELEEYRALRETIRTRGTARISVFVAGLVAWGALTVATAALAELPVATFLPLLILAAAYEAVFSLHIGVERIGRYVQVFLEDEPAWEHTAMAFGPPLRGTRVDPLFTTYFAAAAVLNFIPVMLAEPAPVELIVVGGVHLAVIARFLAGRYASGRQRAIDLDRFRQIRDSQRPR
jgi:hypothetical protein